MNAILFYIILLLMGVVAVILGMGLVNMIRGGSANRSQTLMRWRVIVQFAAVVAMVLALVLFGKG